MHPFFLFPVLSSIYTFILHFRFILLYVVLLLQDKQCIWFLSIIAIQVISYHNSSIIDRRPSLILLVYFIYCIQLITKWYSLLLAFWVPVINIFSGPFFLARKCPTGKLSKVTECQEVGNQLLVLGCDADNWFTAKHICESIGAMLLPTVPPNELKLNCKNRLWIGLRKEKWFHVHPREKVGKRGKRGKGTML